MNSAAETERPFVVYVSRANERREHLITLMAADAYDARSVASRLRGWPIDRLVAHLGRTA